MRIGAGPVGVRNVGGHLLDDDGVPVTFTRGGVTLPTDFEGGPTEIPDPIPPPTSGLIWMSNFDDPGMAPGPVVTPAWAHVQKPRNPGVTGDIRQDSMTIVSAAEAPGSGAWKPAGNVMKVELLPHANGTGDVNASGNSSRAEVYDRHPASASSVPAGLWPDPVDSVRWYGFSVFVPIGFSTSDLWLTILQLKGYYTGSPPLAIEIKNGNFKVGGTLASITLGNINPGNWSRIVIGVRLSPSSTSGWLTAMLNGAESYPQTTRATMRYYGAKADPIYLKQGIYRSSAWAVTHTLYFGPTKIGYSLDDVAS